MLLDAVAIFMIVLIIRDVTKMFWEQFAPDGFVYKAKHRKQPLKKLGGASDEN